MESFINMKGCSSKNMNRNLDYEQSLFFFVHREKNVRDTQMTTRVTEGASRERHDKRETTRKARENGL